MLYLYSNPGIVFGAQLTSLELSLVQSIGDNTYSTGDILYYDGSGFSNLGIGSEDQVLSVSSSGIPEWADASGGGGSSYTAEEGVQIVSDVISLDFSGLTHGVGEFSSNLSLGDYFAYYNTSDSTHYYGTLNELKSLFNIPSTTGNLTDVSSTTPSYGDVLIYTEDLFTGDKYVPRALQAGDIDAESSTDGYVLTSDGAGNATWEAPAGGGGGSMDNFTLAADTGTPETVADGNTLTITGGTGINTSVAATDTVTVALDSSTQASLTLADSSVQPGDNVSDLTNDAGYITATLTQEQVEDFVGAMFSGNTETLITATYQDADGTIDLVVDNDLANFSNTNSDFATNTEVTSAISAIDFPVDSVNGQTDTVVLDADDIDDTSTTNKFVTASDLTNLGNLSGTNSGDVTVTDSSEIDFTLTGQNITASLIAGSIDEAKLDTSVNASLDLADSSLQPGDNVSDLTNDAGYLASVQDGDIDSESATDGYVLTADGAGNAAWEAIPGGGSVTGNKITELTANTTPNDADLAVIVDDVAGTPSNQKITLANLKTYFQGGVEPTLTKTDALEITTKSFLLRINGSNVTFASESLTLPINRTLYIGFDLIDYSLHYLNHNVQDGMIWLGKVVTDGTEITDIESFEPQLPKSRIPQTVENLNNGLETNIALLGDSLIYGAGSGTTYIYELFESSASSYGNNVPNVSSVNYFNFASGGQTTRYGMLWLAKSSKSNTGNYNNTGLSYDAKAQQELFSIANYTELRNSPLLSGKYKLAIVGFGANGGTYAWAYYENIVKTLREHGIEVILITQNNRTDNYSYLEDRIDDIKRMADIYGCAIADTWSFVKESQDDGNTTHDDVIHMAQAGHTAYAKAIRTILNNKDLSGDVVLPATVRSIKEKSVSYLNRNFPNASEFDCTPHATTGSYISSSAPDLINPSLQFKGLASSASILELTAGEYADFGHAYATECDVIIDGSTTGEYELFFQSGTQSKGTTTHTYTGNLPYLKEGVTIPYYTTISSNLYSSKGLRIKCNSGTIKLYGILWHTYKNKTLKFDDIKFNGTWNVEAWSYGHPTSHYTDTLNDSFSFEFEGSDAMLYFSNKNAAGIVDIYMNGVLVYDNLDLYGTGAHIKSVHLHHSSDGVYDLAQTKNQVTVQYVGDNASISASSATNRRLQLLMVKIFDRT